MLTLLDDIHMTKELIDLIEKALRESGIPLSASEVEVNLERNGIDLSLYTDPRSATRPEIQTALEELEALPESRVRRLVLGSATKFQWIS